VFLCIIIFAVKFIDRTLYSEWKRADENWELGDIKLSTGKYHAEVYWRQSVVDIAHFSGVCLYYSFVHGMW